MVIRPGLQTDLLRRVTMKSARPSTALPQHFTGSHLIRSQRYELAHTAANRCAA